MKFEIFYGTVNTMGIHRREKLSIVKNYVSLMVK